MLNRRNVLERLAALLSTLTEIKTVVRSYTPIDISQYSSAELPLLEIREPEESIERGLTSRRQLISMATELRVFFVAWKNEPSQEYETLVKAIRDKIGSSFTLNDSAVACYVDRIEAIEGEVPLFSFTISLRLLYYLDEVNT